LRVKPFVPLTVAVAATTAVTILLRFQLIEPEAYAHLCSAPGAPWWCTPRAGLIAVIGSGALAVAAVGAGVIAIATRRTGAGLAAACLGTAGLALYAVEAGAVGLLLALLAFARPRTIGARRG
jgi:hypothetical protein